MAPASLVDPRISDLRSLGSLDVDPVAADEVGEWVLTFLPIADPVRRPVPGKPVFLDPVVPERVVS